MTVRRHCWRWALVLTVAASVALMHHVVGAHQHSAADAATSTPVGHHELHPTSGQQQDRPTHSPSPVSVSAANLHVHFGQHHSDGAEGAGGGATPPMMLLHACLAVLAAAAIAASLTLAALWGRAIGLVGPRPRRPAPHAASRASPLPIRLAQLQVLRL